MPGGLKDAPGDVKRAIAAYLDPRARAALAQSSKGLAAALSQKAAKLKDLSSRADELSEQLEKQLASLKGVRAALDTSSLFKMRDEDLLQAAADASDDLVDTAKQLNKVVEKLDAGKKVFSREEQKSIEKIVDRFDKQVGAVIDLDVAILRLVKAHFGQT
jgi:methyl-accepting chemotaxis protein